MSMSNRRQIWILLITGMIVVPGIWAPLLVLKRRQNFQREASEELAAARDVATPTLSADGARAWLEGRGFETMPLGENN